MVTNIFQNYYATPLIRLLVRVISDIKVNYSYVSDLGEMFHTNQLKDGECKGAIVFQIFCANL